LLSMQMFYVSILSSLRRFPSGPGDSTEKSLELRRKVLARRLVGIWIKIHLNPNLGVRLSNRFLADLM
jgi:hypothetical protein